MIFSDKPHSTCYTTNGKRKPEKKQCCSGIRVQVSRNVICSYLHFLVLYFYQGSQLEISCIHWARSYHTLSAILSPAFMGNPPAKAVYLACRHAKVSETHFPLVQASRSGCRVLFLKIPVTDDAELELLVVILPYIHVSQQKSNATIKLAHLLRMCLISYKYLPLIKSGPFVNPNLLIDQHQAKNSWTMLGVRSCYDLDFHRQEQFFNLQIDSSYLEMHCIHFI